MRQHSAGRRAGAAGPDHQVLRAHHYHHPRMANRGDSGAHCTDRRLVALELWDHPCGARHGAGGLRRVGVADCGVLRSPGGSLHLSKKRAGVQEGGGCDHPFLRPVGAGVLCGVPHLPLPLHGGGRADECVDPPRPAVRLVPLDLQHGLAGVPGHGVEPHSARLLQRRQAGGHHHYRRGAAVRAADGRADPGLLHGHHRPAPQQIRQTEEGA
mmetsp:Transcript_21508/g.52697  ORF Transcript_21508/g.52697 Transcript_21508/m.52697 type:complete len:212 (-) Transcript_21508:1749-2384(-)